MDIKKLFGNNKAVSPVIGVILMVAITVILAAAIGSSVFGQGTTESAPQANLDIKAFGPYTAADSVAYVKIEHLGGDMINLDATSTKTMITRDGISEQVTPINIVPSGGTANTIINVGDVKKFSFKDTTAEKKDIVVSTGDIVNIKAVDIQTSQILFDKDVRF